MPSTSPDPPPQLLESRPDWAAGVATTAGRKELVGHWVGAVIMNALGLPVGWMALFGGRDLPVYLEVVLPSFTLLGLLILFVAVRESFRWRRFGRLEMTLDPLPGSIGGHVGGSLELPIHQATASDCRVMLMCIRDRLVKTKDGSSRSESVEWAKEKASRMSGAREVASGSDTRSRFRRGCPPPGSRRTTTTNGPFGSKPTYPGPISTRCSRFRHFLWIRLWRLKSRLCRRPRPRRSPTCRPGWCGCTEAAGD